MPDERVTGLLDRLAGQVLRKAPADWTGGVLTGDASRLSAGGAIDYRLPGGRTVRVFPDYDDLFALYEALNWNAVNLELTAEPSGAYRALAIDAAVSPWTVGEGYDAVLDRHIPEEPGHEQDGPEDATPLGDPELAVSRLHEYLERRARLIGEDRSPAPPATSEAIENAEQAMGVKLPADLRAIYEVADGGAGIFDGHDWLSLEEVVQAHRERRRRIWFGWEMSWDALVFDARPPETVRRCTGHPRWIPFAHDYGGNYLAVDMSPARAGRPGQVIAIGRDHEDGPTLIAGSVTDLLGVHLDLLDRGDYYATPGYLEFLVERASRGQVSAVLDPAKEPLDGAALSGIQELVVRQTGEIELPALDTATMRSLRLHRDARVPDLNPLRDLPLERLTITVRDGDLTSLTPHGTLRALRLATAGTPVRIAPLRDLPRLSGLDLTEADVADLNVLADLHGLRYLVMRADQWDAATPPPGMAAASLQSRASLQGRVTLGAAINWAVGLGGDTGNILRHSGHAA